MIVVEYYNSPTTSVRWQRLGAFEEDETDKAREYLDGYRGARRNYVVRARNTENDHIYGVIPAITAEWVGHPENVDIEWRDGPQIPMERAKNMIKVGVKRVQGKLCLLVNAKEFHEQLDEIGCTHTNNKYNDAPATANSVSSSTHQMSTNVLLLRDYKDVEVVESKKVGDAVEKNTIKVPVTACIDLSQVWSNPPSFDNLKKLCNSANDAARKILEHYQPIDISVEIHKKVVKS